MSREATRDAAERARGRAETVGVVEGAADEAATLDALGAALSFPSWFGGNLDALADCLRDLSWLPPGLVVIVWDDGALQADDPAAHAAVLDVLEDAVAAQDAGPWPLEVVLVS